MIIPYLILLFMYVIFGALSPSVNMQKSVNRKNNTLFLTLCGLYLVLFIGLRGTHVGDDTVWYKYYFFQETDHEFFDFSSYTSSHFEIGYRIITKLIALFTHNEQIYLIIVAAISVYLWMKAISLLSPEKPFNTLLYGTLFIQSYFYFYMNVIRQGIACSILALALYQLFNKKYIRYFVLVLVAATFHSFALLFIPLIALEKVSITRKNYIKINIIVLASLSIFSRIAKIVTERFFPRYVYYFVTDYNSRQRIGPRAILLLLVGVFLIAMNYQILKYNEDNNKRRIAFYYGVISTLGTVLLYNMQNFGILERCARYFNYYYMFSLTFVLVNLRKRTYLQIYRMLILCALMTFYIYNLATNYNGLTPYTLFFLE